MLIIESLTELASSAIFYEIFVLEEQLFNISIIEDYFDLNKFRQLFLEFLSYWEDLRDLVELIRLFSDILTGLVIYLL